MSTLLFSLTFLLALLSVAFFTLLERKFLRASQLRKGPGKVGVFGVFQPFADALKLFRNENLRPTASNKAFFLGSAITALALSLLYWQFYQPGGVYKHFRFPILLTLVILGLSVYPVFLAGWASNRCYAFLGALRACAQSISFEISLVFIIFTLAWLGNKYQVRTDSRFPLIILCLPLLWLWILTILAETQRAPFDFAEGERELVRGFNIEFGSARFSLLFLAEISTILFFAGLTSCFFRNGYLLGVAVISCIFLIARTSYPRFRYDLLMYTFWQLCLPLSTFLVCLVVI